MLLIGEGVGKVSVPDEMRATSELPLKIFNRLVANELSVLPVAAGLSKASLEHTVGGVIGAIFSEVEALRVSEGTVGRVKWHGSVDAAWKGSSARGCGLACDAKGEGLIKAASERIAVDGSNRTFYEMSFEMTAVLV